jgi:hypothetical protein
MFSKPSAYKSINSSQMQSIITTQTPSITKIIAQTPPAYKSINISQMHLTITPTDFIQPISQK